MTDLEWVRDQCKERKLTNVSDSCIALFLGRFIVKEIALEAIDSVWHGKHFVFPLDDA